MKRYRRFGSHAMSTDAARHAHCRVRTKLTSRKVDGGMERSQRPTDQRAIGGRDGTNIKVATLAAAWIATRTNAWRKEWKHAVQRNGEKILDVEAEGHERLDERLETGSPKDRAQIIEGGSEKATRRDGENRPVT